MKGSKKHTLKCVVIFITFAIIICLCNKFEIIGVPESDNLINTQFNLLTINTVFAGFSFTVLGMIISLSDTTILKALKETPFLRNYCSIVAESIFDFIISVVISLYFIIGLNNWIEGLSPEETDIFTVKIPYIVELLFLIKGIMLFTLSVVKLLKILNKNFKDNEKKGNEKIKKFEEAMKSKG